MFKDTKERLSKRTGIKGKLLEKVKFAVVSKSSFSRPEYLQDGKLMFNIQESTTTDSLPDDILFDKLVSSEDLLGLDHVNKSRNLFNRADAMMIR